MKGKRDIYLMRDGTAIRTQVVLTREQHEVLARLAKAFDRSISDFVREGVNIIIDGYYHPLIEIEREGQKAEREAKREER